MSSSFLPAKPSVEEGLALLRAGRFEEAQAVYQTLLDADPGHFDALHFLGVVYHQRGEHLKALSLFDRAKAVFPQGASLHSNRGLSLVALRRLEEALESYERSIALDPTKAVTHYNRGLVQLELGRPEAALASFDAAIALWPDFIEAHCDRGSALLQSNFVDAAVDSYRRAVDLDWRFTPARLNIALAFAHANRLDEAMRILEGVLEAEPGHAEARRSKGMIHLLQGQYELGWKDYEARVHCAAYASSRRQFREPRWDGQEPLTGKTLLLHWEQGLGDTIQFSRYAALVAGLGARVILEVQRPLLGLMQRLSGTAQVLAHGDTLPNFQLHCPLLSLPLIFRTDAHSIPAPCRYLQAPPEKVSHWQSVLGARRKPRVGLAWRGAISNWILRRRQVPLSELLAGLPEGFEYVILQRELTDEDRQVLERRRDVVSLGERLEDFADTAAVCENLDLIVSVDTSVAHLAASLGRPTWILLTFSADWRWLLGRTDSPWYPTARLYRQPTAGEWKPILTAITQDLLSSGLGA